MNPRWILLALPLLLLSVPAAAVSGGHYLPQAGDRFQYAETTFLNRGTGNYTGYSESTYLNGTLGVTTIASNGTESASYQSSGIWSNSTGATQVLNDAGTFTFSAVTFHYVQGTDNQTGYSNPYVWFYMNNSLGVGGSFYILNTPMTVESTASSYSISGPLAGTYATIAAQGSGTFQRDDVYGVFTAAYTWQEYFDPATGYIVGYVYTEEDSDGAGDGFTITDQLHVTSTTYALTPAAAAAPPSNPAPAVPWLLIGIVVIVVVLLSVVALLLGRHRRSPNLPRHSGAGNIGYGPPPPPINLIPSQQPPVPQVVLRETVKVNCRYCGTLIDSTATVCPNCGAPRT
jgi:hypothetical protein